MGWKDAPLVTEGWKDAPLVNPPPLDSVGIESIPSLEQEEPLTDRGEWGKRGITKYTGELVGEAKEAGLDLLALTEVAGTIGTGAVSSITAAAFGATAMLFGRDPAQTASDVEHYSQLGTYMPKGERGQELLEDIAEPLMKLEEGASDLSWWLADGNPAAATAIKTTLLGAAELALPSKGAIKGMKVGRELRQRAAEMEKLADELGVDISQSGLAASVVALAKRMTPEQRATHMPYLRDQLKAASEKAIARKDALYAEADAAKTYVNTRSVDALVKGIRGDLAKRFDLDEMPRVQRVLKKLHFDTGPKPSVLLESLGVPEKLPPVVVDLRKFENVRKKINNDISDALVRKPSEAKALIEIKKRMGEFLDNELYEATIDAGKSAISGDMTGIQAYKAARAAAADWYKRFDTDKVIVQFINKDATAETMAQWLLGSSATGVAAKREAGAIIGRMKDILGESHPAIRGIRADYLYEVASPLLHPDGPNFNTFVRNYELMVDRNPSLVKALDLKRGDFKELHNLARLQKTLPLDKATARDVIKRITTITSRLAVGHEIAKAGVKVNLFRDALNLTLQLDRITQKQMFYELAGMKYGDVLLPKKGPLAGQFIAGAALTEIADAQEQLGPSQE
jgi:hypothetical protein